MKLLLQPLPVRIFHWVMFSCVIGLLWTGLYMNDPFEAVRLPLRTVRKVHAFLGLSLTANLAGQIYYYWRTTKWTELLFLTRDLVNIRSFARYVFFITGGHPNYGRYNPGQKALFTLWGAAVLIAIVTGFTLLLPDMTTGLQRLLNGLNTIRISHFGVAIFFAMSIPLHLYLVFTEDPAKLQAMFTGYIQVEPKLPPASPDNPYIQGHAEDGPHR